MAAVSFPNAGVLRRALEDGVVPATFARGPARFAADADGRLWIEPASALPPPLAAALRKLGARVQGACEPRVTEEICCWAEAVPLEAGSPAGPARFEVADARQLPRLVRELEQLGGGPPEWGADPETGRGWVRTSAAPQAAVYRAEFDPGVDLFVEQSPGIWVAGGWRHPFPRPIEPPPGQEVLIRPDHRWLFRPASGRMPAPTRLALPGGIHPANAAPPRVTAEPRLVPDRAAGPAELWVIRDDPVARLTEWLGRVDDRIVSRLLVARLTIDGAPAVALWAKPGRTSAPVVLIEADAYRSYLKLPNLFVPTSRRLTPPLRRDLARVAYAADAGELVWLSERDGRLVRSAVPVAAFQPLPQHVSYQPPPAACWAAAEPFHLYVPEPFLVKDRPTPARIRPVVPPRGATGESAAAAPVWQALMSWVKGAWTFVPRGPVTPTSAPPERPEPLIAASSLPVDELEQSMCRDIETHAPEIRPERWAELARAQAAAGRRDDAAVSWQIALWEDDRPDWAEAWLRTDCPRGVPDWEAAADPASARGVAAWLVHEATRGSAGLPDALGRARRWLDEHEDRLGVRAYWLANAALARLSGGDPLGLATARDAVFERLYRCGLTPDRDVPGFLIAADPATTSRRRAAREWLPGAADAARAWLGVPVSRSDDRLTEFGLTRERFWTPRYSDEIFSVSRARVGDPTDPAHERPGLVPTPVSAWLMDAFAVRRAEARAGQSWLGDWPGELVVRRAALSPDDRYGIDKLREHLRTLDIPAAVDAYAAYHGRGESPFASVADRPTYAAALRAALEEHPPGAVARQRAILEALTFGPRFGPEAAGQAIDEALRELVAATRVDAGVRLLTRAWRAAGLARLTAPVEPLTRETLKALGRKGWSPRPVAELVEAAGPVLARADNRDGLTMLAERAARLLHGDDPETVAASLRVAGLGWWTGRGDSAHAALDAAKPAVFEAHAPIGLILAYIAAAGPAPAAIAFGRFDEALRRLPVPTSQSSTNRWYALDALRTLDAVATAAAGDASAGPALESWLMRDELRVRDRIRRDLAAAGVS